MTQTCDEAHRMNMKNLQRVKKLWTWRKNKRDDGYAALHRISREQRLAVAKASLGIALREGGCCKIGVSVFGAALAMPQFARTCGWDTVMTSLAVRSWLFLMLTIGLQASLLCMIQKEEMIMDPIAGQMFLCDFGKHVDSCPGPGCTGPGGTDITAPRMYSFAVWSTRNFVKESLKAIFPDRIVEIDEAVDPGEYGVECASVRILCVFVFMIFIFEDALDTMRVAYMLYAIPTAKDAFDELWITPLDDESSATEAPPALPIVRTQSSFISEHKLMGSRFELSNVRVGIAGMPLKWKLINVTCIIVPKSILFVCVCRVSVLMLMETAGIQDCIVNCCALTFILSLDEAICSTLMHNEVQALLSACEDFPLYEVRTSHLDNLSTMTDDQILEEHEKTRKWNRQRLMMLFPMKLVWVLALTLLFVRSYYWERCQLSSDGVYVSNDLYPPTSTALTLQSLLQFDYHSREDKPSWVMPEHP